MGTDSAIFRTLGKQTAMRTDQYNSRWLNGNVSTRGLFCSQLFPLPHSSLSRPIFNLFLGSRGCRSVSPYFPYVASSPPGTSSVPRAVSSRNESVDFSTWPHDRSTRNTKCTMLIGDCMPAEPGSEVRRVVAKGNNQMSIMTQSGLCSLMNRDCHSNINAGWVLLVDVAKPMGASPTVSGSQTFL